jgi:hypothetical protein
MPTPDEQKINALRFALSQKIDAAQAASNALTAEQRRQGLVVSQEFYTDAEMTAERIAAHIELREVTAAVIADCRHRHDPSYVPDPMHKALLSLFGTEAKTVDNVVRLASAREIIEAGRKRRGDQ